MRLAQNAFASLLFSPVCMVVRVILEDKAKLWRKTLYEMVNK